MVVADTSVWVSYLRDPNTDTGNAMDSLLRRREVLMVGVVLAEILQGARSTRQFDELEDRLTAMSYLDTGKDAWVGAAHLFRELRAKGAMIPITDLLIAATALQYNEPVYTLDEHFERVPGLRLFSPGNDGE